MTVAPITCVSAFLTFIYSAAPIISCSRTWRILPMLPFLHISFHVYAKRMKAGSNVKCISTQYMSCLLSCNKILALFVAQIMCCLFGCVYIGLRLDTVLIILGLVQFMLYFNGSYKV